MQITWLDMWGTRQFVCWSGQGQTGQRELTLWLPPRAWLVILDRGMAGYIGQGHGWIYQIRPGSVVSDQPLSTVLGQAMVESTY